MKCEQVSEWMMDYLDGELPRKEARLVEEHLRSCEECNQEFEETKEVLDAVADNVEDPGDAYFASLYPRIMERIEAGEMLPWYRRLFSGTPTFVKWSMTAVPVALALVLAVIYVLPGILNPNVDNTMAAKKANPVKFGIAPNMLIAQRTAQQVEDMTDQEVDTLHDTLMAMMDQAMEEENGDQGQYLAQWNTVLPDSPSAYPAALQALDTEDLELVVEGLTTDMENTI